MGKKIEVEVEVNLDEFDDDDIADEYEYRGLGKNVDMDVKALAEFIVHGELEEALEFLARYDKDAFSLSVMKRKLKDSQYAKA